MTMIPLSPDILYFHILPRLPAKSVHRFLCVCKQWQSFLVTPMFAKMHHHHHHKLLLIVLSTTTPCKFQTLDCESPEDGLSAVSRPLPFEVASHENMSIIASVRGLVCVRLINKSNEREFSDLILWNPLTGEYRTLSAPNNKERHVTTVKVFGLYYSCNDYKLLLITCDHDVYIYSLKSDSWRKVEITQEDLEFLSHLHWFWRCWEQPCILLNEKLYFLVRRAKRKITIIGYSIIMFDLKTEKLIEIATPCFKPDQNMTWAWCLNFTIIRGCIHLYVRYWNVKSTTFLGTEMWRMDGDGDWTKIVTYDPPSFPRFSDLLLHCMKNGNCLGYDQSGIFKIDVEKHTREEICSSNSIIIHKEGKYVETLGINLFNKHQKPLACNSVDKGHDEFAQI